MQGFVITPKLLVIYLALIIIMAMYIPEVFTVILFLGVIAIVVTILPKIMKGIGK